ncbi:HsdM family class I SAM-dependent methyltransferase [Solwaraspora sp. WMMB762]|uniref:HsdM family class I SAM-dependent methyltransferase n=1 Tax=Solwaraspora sp. WMMB762 TaxID=3404120 RepID=UPI003B93D5AB
MGKSFAGWPVDLAIFDDVSTVGQWEHLLVICEFKAPTLSEGASQLEIYLAREPRARVGYWSNGSESLTVLKRADGTFQHRGGGGIPRPGDNFEQPSEKPLTYSDLVIPDGGRLKAVFKRLLDAIVARDSKSTRSDGQLNQLCNLLLLKLDSDTQGSFEPREPLAFQLSAAESATARTIRRQFDQLRTKNGDVFANDNEPGLFLDDHTIQAAVYELSSLNLLEVGAEAVSSAFQVFRRANLKAGEGQYFTPQRVISSAVRLMDIRPGDKIIDPACGTGGFLVEAFRHISKMGVGANPGAARTWAHRNVFGIDKDSINVKLSRAVMVILGDGSAHIHVGDSLLKDRWQRDYPHLPPSVQDGAFSVVITNPPFGRNLRVSRNDGKRNGYTVTRAGGREHRDVEIGLVFVERAHQLLMPGGRLGIILPETYFFSSSYRWFTSWLEERFTLRGAVNIPMEAFQGFCRAKTNFYILEKR